MHGETVKFVSAPEIHSSIIYYSSSTLKMYDNTKWFYHTFVHNYFTLIVFLLYNPWWWP